MQGEKPLILSFTDAKNFPGYDEMYGNPLRILMAMVGLVLLIALANVAMLLAARNAARQREFSVRQALGAGRGELFRQLLTESLILVTAGGALAWAFAMMAARLLANWAQIESSLAPDRTVLLFTMGVLVVAALLFGLAPMRVALAGRAELAIKTSAATSNTDAGKSRTGKIIVALQMAMCVVLLVGAGLLIRTLRNLENTPLGMRVDGLVVFGVNPDIPSLPAGRSFYRESDAQAAHLAWRRVGHRYGRAPRFRLVRQQRHDGRWTPARCLQRRRSAPCAATWPGLTSSRPSAYPFSKAAISLTPTRRTSPPVGIINEEFAKRFLPNQNPLGHHIGTDDGRYTMTVVGVVKNHKYRSIDETPIPMAWYMYAQIPMIGAMSVEMRVKGAPLAILPSAQKVVQQLDPNLPLIKPMTQRAQYDTTISSQIMFARLAEFFGLLAVVLVATGLYGTLSYRVNRRTAEIGVRMAMGAGRGQVVWMILRDSLRLTVIGVVAGVPLSHAHRPRLVLVTLRREAARRAHLRACRCRRYSRGPRRQCCARQPCRQRQSPQSASHGVVLNQAALAGRVQQCAAPR